MQYFVDTAFPPPYRQVHLIRRGEFDMAMHQHAFWQLIVVTDGLLEITTERGDTPIRNTLSIGMVHILPPGCPHALHSTGYTQVGIDLSPDAADSRSVAAMLAAHYRVPVSVPVPGAAQLGRELELLHRYDSLLSHAQMVNRVDALLLACAAVQAQPYLEQPLLDYLDAHLAANLRLSDIAAAFFISVPQLERRCRQAFGCGVITLQMRRKLAAAQSELLRTDDSVAAVARAVGFSDPAHFSSFFRRFTGLSPRAWRAQARNPSSLP